MHKDLLQRIKEAENEIRQKRNNIKNGEKERKNMIKKI